MSLAISTKQQRLDPTQETLIPTGGFFDGIDVVNGNSTPETMHDCAFPLRSDDGSGNRQAVAFNLRGREGGAMPEATDVASVRAASGGSSRSYVAATAVRRLTPRECERLQGFPDDYLDIIYRGKPAADGPKYKALGNSWAVPCVRWIGQRMAMVHAPA